MPQPRNQTAKCTRVKLRRSRVGRESDALIASRLALPYRCATHLLLRATVLCQHPDSYELPYQIDRQTPPTARSLFSYQVRCRREPIWRNVCQHGQLTLPKYHPTALLPCAPIQHTMISRSTLSGVMRVAIASATARIEMNAKTKMFETSKMIKKISIKDKMVKKFKSLY